MIYPIFGVGCIDGRVLPTLIAGLVAKIGGFLRIPAGDPNEFVKLGGDLSNKTVLLEESNFAKRLDEAFTSRGDDIVELLDSHVACAAREIDEKKKKNEPKIDDKGLYADVLRKKEMAQAMIDHVVKKNVETKTSKKVHPIQISFNPNNGFCYMGLETEDAMELAQRNGNLFTDKVLGTLVDSGKIISTEQIAKDPKVHEILFNKYFNVDWENKYVDTAKKFWTKIKEIVDENPDFIDGLEAHVRSIYPNMTDAKEIKLRTLLILANTYSGFLLNFKGVYPYSKHTEEIIVVSEGGYSPYKVSSFAIHILDEKNIPKAAKLAYDLIRNNRRENRANFGYQIFEPRKNKYEVADPKRRAAYNEAPVPIVIQETVRFDKVPDESVSTKRRSAEGERFWRDMNKIKDFSFLREIDWINMTSDEFKQFLRGRFSLYSIRNEKIFEEIDNLRARVVSLYQDKTVYPNEIITDEKPVSTARLVYERKLVLLSAIGDEERGIRTIIPFIDSLKDINFD